MNLDDVNDTGCGSMRIEVRHDDEQVIPDRAARGMIRNPAAL
jgi:hypothetical protein